MDEEELDRERRRKQAERDKEKMRAWLASRQGPPPIKDGKRYVYQSGSR